MHLAERMDLPRPYRARPYRGSLDHQGMARVLAAYREHAGDPEMPTVDQIDVTYAHLTDCDPTTDVAIVEADGSTIAYGRIGRSGDDRSPDCTVFVPIHPAHHRRGLFDAMVTAHEAHGRRWVDGAETARFRAYAAHPGPGRPPTGEAAWLEARGYAAIRWGAGLVRPDLDDVPDLTLPEGVEVRPVRSDQIRRIWEEHEEAFRGEWDFEEPTPESIDASIAEPYSDPTLWKVAWAGDEIVGQVKSFINPVENEARGYRRGYTEQISTHHDWRNRGIAGALLAMSLRELRARGMTEAALGVDTDNPGGAFQLYTKLGFELRNYEAVYARPAR